MKKVLWFLLSCLIVLFIFIILPALIMGNCSNFAGEGMLEIAGCAVDTPFLRGLAEIMYRFLLLSAFLLGAPLIAYGVFMLLSVYFLYKAPSFYKEKKLGGTKTKILLFVYFCFILGLLSFISKLTVQV